jgi:hypothetical protein
MLGSSAPVQVASSVPVVLGPAPVVLLVSSTQMQVLQARQRVAEQQTLVVNPSLLVSLRLGPWMTLRTQT